MKFEKLKKFLDKQVDRFNCLEFIESDPISIPHLFSKKQDIEIAGLWTAILSWGQRKTIIKKSRDLMQLMDWAPHQFVTQHQEKDLHAFLNFKHRTFQPDDSLHFIQFFKTYYAEHESLEQAFIPATFTSNADIGEGLDHFRELFFDNPCHLPRTRKHISSPSKGSACKRLNMFLRWMVRKDERGVDFGIWKNIHSSQLMIPLDLHVFRVARSLDLLKSKQSNWKAVVELTQKLREMDVKDPVKYDYALFGLGVLQNDLK